MSCKRTSKRSLDDWMELVTACRQSGMTDADWCAEHGISQFSIMQLPGCENRPARYQIRLKKSVLWILHPETGCGPDCYRTGEFSGRTASNPWTVLCTLTIHIQLKSKQNGILIRMSNSVQPLSFKSVAECAEGVLYVSGYLKRVDAIYIVCGRTDMRKSIDGLCAIIKDQFSMELDHSLYLFCGRKCDRIKSYSERTLDGIVLIYKRVDGIPGFLPMAKE